MSVGLTPLAVSVLALLNERSMHPYEMVQLLRERREDWLVKVRPGSLYHTVERLADAGLLAPTGTDRAGRRPERTTYAITATGQDALRSRVAEVLHTPVNEYPAFPAALSEAHNLPLGEAVDHLEHRAALLDDLIAEAGSMIERARSQDIPEAYWFVADYLRAMHTTERDWIRRTLARLRSEELEWPRPN